MFRNQSIDATIKYLKEIRDTLNELYYWNEHGSYPHDQIQYQLIENTLDELILNIRNCDSFEEAQPFFDTTVELSEYLGLIYFKCHIELPPRIEAFTRRFDNIYEPRIREYHFFNIKAGNDILSPSFKDLFFS